MLILCQKSVILPEWQLESLVCFFAGGFSSLVGDVMLTLNLELNLKYRKLFQNHNMVIYVPMFILTWWGLIDYNLAYGRRRKEMERCIEPKFQCQSHMICRETQIIWQWWCKLGCFLANIYIYEICSMLIDASQTATKYIPMCLHYTHPSKKLLAGGFSNNPLYTKLPRVHIKRVGGFKHFLFSPLFGEDSHFD